ncbi:MAG: hypothetical protein H7146_06445 [Burkholderiaceae bacterium]|nr:hypothetical protein [Microbacteriaceae bacterium]
MIIRATRRTPRAATTILAAIVLATVAATTAAILIAPHAASAAQPTPVGEPGIEVSRNGVNFTSTLDDSLFSGLGAVVPHDSVSEVLWVRNTTAERAYLRISGTRAAASSDEFARAISVGASDSTRPLAVYVPLAEIGDCTPLLPDATVGAGEVIRIDLGLRIADLSDRVAQGDSARVSVLVSLRDPGSAGFTPSDCPRGITIPVLPESPQTAGGHSPASTGVPFLAFTGTSPLAPALTAVALTAVGLAVIGVTARRRARR